jgi:hypothetical protein
MTERQGTSKSKKAAANNYEVAKNRSRENKGKEKKFLKMAERAKKGRR